MKRIFITYGDAGFEKAKERIIFEAKNAGVFDEIKAYGPEHLSAELKASDVFKIPRGGGLWSWKPDVVLTTMNTSSDGDIIVYCDAGCSLYDSTEWQRYWKKLSSCDIIAQRLLQPTERWSKKELISYFKANGNQWTKDFQYMATVLFFKNTSFSRSLVNEWREIMIHHPECVTDVSTDQLHLQHPAFIDSRHDQSVYSALIYNCLSDPLSSHLIFTQWEHVEFLDILTKQAIRATRLRYGEIENLPMKLIAIRRRLLIDFILKPFSGIPHHWWYNR